jgi:hypothetical protein
MSTNVATALWSLWLDNKASDKVSSATLTRSSHEKLIQYGGATLHPVRQGHGEQGSSRRKSYLLRRPRSSILTQRSTRAWRAKQLEGEVYLLRRPRSSISTQSAGLSDGLLVGADVDDAGVAGVAIAR